MRLSKKGNNFLSSSTSIIFWQPVVGLAMFNFMSPTCRYEQAFQRYETLQVPDL